ncbi:MAG: peptidoglycan DD-metalloendopeptidase family protein [Clostridia bacterium]|nr:peptidoglycan DD-metalloendopeptidase family protein [Clostridia bacterium]
MKIKYILFIIIALLLTGTTAYADTVPNAITFPTVIDDMTVVNLREGPSTGTEKLGSVEMYSNIYVNGEAEAFYSAAAKCTDNGTRGGFISKDYVKLFENLGTAYVASTTDDKYNMSYISVHRYPFASSEKTDKLTPGTNLNLLLHTEGWYYCEYNGKYGFVQTTYVQAGWMPAVSLTEAEALSADKSGANAVLFAANDRTVIINGEATEVEQPVISYYNTTMMPVKNISIFWNGNVNWNDSEKCATAIVRGKTLKIKNDSDIISVDGADIKMTAKAFIRDSRLYVPIRAVTDALGIKIYYFGQGVPFIASSDELDYPKAKYILDKFSKKFDHSSALLAWPVPSSSGLSSSFGDGRGHKAIDITAEKGAPVVASGSGVITEVFTGCTHDYPKSESCCGGGYGNYVVITHGHTIEGHQVKTRYSHLSRTDAAVGQLVSTGDVVGYIGCTGHSTGDHLDFELSLDDVKTDPAPYISVPENLYDSGNNPLYTQPYIDKLLNIN